VHRAIPPDSAHARLPKRDGAPQHEAVGDLHFAADNFASAVEEYSTALSALGTGAPAERCRLLLRLAQTHQLRGDYDASLRALEDARAAARVLESPRQNALIAAGAAHALMGLGEYRRSRSGSMRTRSCATATNIRPSAKWG
jgi:ATP/maltotriose-dependent transcriptional regulator MalT